MHILDMKSFNEYYGFAWYKCKNMYTKMQLCEIIF